MLKYPMGIRLPLGLLLLFFSFTAFSFDEAKLASSLGLEIISEGNPYNYLGINKIYANSSLTRQLLIVSDVPGTIKERRIFTQKGFLIYEIPKSANSYVSMAIVGITQEEVDQILGAKTTVWKTLKRELNPLSSAYASSDCGIEGQASMGDLDQIGSYLGSSVSSGAAKCISSFLQGIWDATGGQIADAYEGIKNLANNPKKFWSGKVEQFNNIKSFILNFESKMNELVENISSLPEESKIMLICNFVGSFGTSSAISMLTGGAGAAKLLLQIEGFVSKISGMNKVFSALRKIGKLEKMPPEFFKNLGNGKIPDKVLDNLNTFAKHDMPEVITAAMKCSSSVSKSCATYGNLAEYLSTKKFIKISKEQRLLKKEALLQLTDVNQARSVVYKFPAFKELGFGTPGGTGWTSYTGRLEKSSAFGKKVGWNIKNENGHARVRLDWDKEKGAHYNIEITQKGSGKAETHKLAVSFLCQGKICTEQQYIKLTDKIQ